MIVWKDSSKYRNRILKLRRMRIAHLRGGYTRLSLRRWSCWNHRVDQGWSRLTKNKVTLFSLIVRMTIRCRRIIIRLGRFGRGLLIRFSKKTKNKTWPNCNYKKWINYRTAIINIYNWIAKIRVLSFNLLK